MKCTGYEKNTAVSDLMDSDFVHANSVVAENLAYVAEPLQDNASDFGDIRFGSPFGPSYALRVKFEVSNLIEDLRNNVKGLPVPYSHNLLKVVNI